MQACFPEAVRNFPKEAPPHTVHASPRSPVQGPRGTPDRDLYTTLGARARNPVEGEVVGLEEMCS